MKNAILFLLLAVSFTAQSQSDRKPTLKELLYGGKLKLDSTGVIRKSDDLSTKIDTSTKKAVEPTVQKPAPVQEDGIGKAIPPTGMQTAVVDSVDLATAPGAAAPTATTPAKSNTKIWKDYSDSLLTTFKTELLTSKKIKKDTYFTIVDYEIGLDGAVTILNVISTPENAFLQDEIKKRMELTVPQLAPVVDSSGKPRKVKRKYNFSIIKE
jgi:hypothetical protein